MKSVYGKRKPPSWLMSRSYRRKPRPGQRLRAAPEVEALEDAASAQTEAAAVAAEVDVSYFLGSCQWLDLAIGTRLLCDYLATKLAALELPYSWELHVIQMI